MFKKTPLSLGIHLVIVASIHSLSPTAWADEPTLLKRATPTTPVAPAMPASNVSAPTQMPVASAITPSIAPNTAVQNTPLPAFEKSPATHLEYTAQTPIGFERGTTEYRSQHQPDTSSQLPPINPAEPINQSANIQIDTSILPTGSTTATPQRTLLAKPTKNLSTQSNQSLAELAKFYTKTPQTKAKQSTCQGVWRYPYPITVDSNIHALANYGYYDAKTHAELSGNVIVSQNGRQVRAGKLTLNPATGQSHATGQVWFGGHDTTPHGSLMGVANQLSYNTQTGAITAQDVAFASSELSAHGHAQHLSTPTASSYLVEQAMFSTCPPDDRVWHIRADQIHLDKETGRGIAKNTTFAIKNTPIFYLPYFNFPIDNRRQSGFLLPQVGINSNDGLQISTPYYLNLAPNYDATITPTIYTNRNPRFSGEFRYLTRLGQGKIDTAYLPKDKEYHNKDRSHLFVEHTWKPFSRKNLNIFAHYRHVSDSRYLSDFDTLGLENNALNLSRTIGASYHTPHLSAHLAAETFQKLEGADRFGNLISDKDRPYSRLPQLSLHYTLPKHLSPYADVAWTNNSAYFKKSIKDGSDTEKSGVRTYNQLTAEKRFSKPWGYVHPKVSLSHLYTSYDEDSLIEQKLHKDDGSHSVLAPSVSIDTALFFEKKGSVFSKLFNDDGGYQVLSPRLKYLYTPYKDQSRMPNFETSVASPSYNQLLGDSWFLGYDRIGDIHAITPALSYRYVDKMGNTRLDVGVADQIYLDNIKVGLNDTIDFNQSHSGLSWQASVHPSQKFWISSAGSFNQDNKLSAVTGFVNYKSHSDKLFNVGVIRRRGNDGFGQLPLYAYTASAILPLDERWRLAATSQYDVKNKQFMDTLIGLSYEDCCIGFSIYGRQYKNELNPQDKHHRAIMAEIRLSGITEQGRLANLLREKILGFW